MRTTGSPKQFDQGIIIVILLFIFSFLVIFLGITDLYDLVRHCITSMLVVYLGWQGLSRRNLDKKE